MTDDRPLRFQPHKICVRKSDGALFAPSTPPGYTTGQAFADVLSGADPKFYFVGVRWEPAPWWKFWTRGRWVRRPEVWEPDSGEFDVVDPDPAQIVEAKWD